MPLKNFKPNTPSARYKNLPSFEEVTKSKPEKSLLTPLKRSGGRNNTGRITCRHIGGGHKRHYRLIDFKRGKHDVPATVVGIEYDPNRTCRIALIQYEDGQKSYILAPIGLEVGTTVVAGAERRAQDRQCHAAQRRAARNLHSQHRTHPGQWRQGRPRRRPARRALQPRWRLGAGQDAFR